MNDRYHGDEPYIRAERHREEQARQDWQAENAEPRTSPFDAIVETDQVTVDGRLFDVDWFFCAGGIELVKVTVPDSPEGCMLRLLNEATKDKLRAEVLRKHNKVLANAIDALAGPMGQIKHIERRIAQLPHVEQERRRYELELRS